MKRTLCVAIALLVLIIAQPSEVQAQGTLPRFERANCPIEVPSDASIDCGTLVTLENYDDPDSRMIRLPVIVVRSRNGEPAGEAMLFTEGGPGFSSLQSVWWLASSDFANQRDLVILEQRGNKFAEPNLTCDFSVWTRETEVGTPCLENLRQRGIALEYYTTASIAADINALVQALDYKSWILYGTSYSTRPMQLVMARYPENVRGVVLHSTLPVTDTRYQHDTEHTARVLQVMFDDCAADPACAEAYPELEYQFYEWVQKLNQDPVEFEMNFPGSTEHFTLDVNGDMLINFMVEDAFYGPAYPPFETAYLPLLIDKLSRGSVDLLYPWAKEYVSRWGSDDYAWGLYFAISCQDDAPSTNPKMVEALAAAYPQLDGYIRHREELAICEAWGLDPAPPLATQPVVSDIPTLILAGTYDPITPPVWSRTAVVNLSSSTFVEFPSSGHSVLRDNPCAQRITAEFLDDPGVEPDLSCMEAVSGPKFVLPNEIIIAPDIYEIHYAELGYSKLEENLFLGSWLTLLGTGVIALTVGLVKMVRRRNQPRSSKQPVDDAAPRMAHPLLIILAITSLGWGYALRFTLQSVAATTPNVLRFGLPVAYWWIFAIAILIGLMTIALIAIAVLAWVRSAWSLVGRIAFTLTTLAAITFSGVLANWGLFIALLR